ncbi:unnamed protein product [Eruca vesicaria subsp. sativa]|uniref:Uncharacterized protein n=1 Tax=Eruca vesicaria subsp. sativa TaxID=29727 RepID=A0ABC8LZ96_ERUVS|nr:unnamed protein product [Eruca vesicaria subsp. sativa]
MASPLQTLIPTMVLLSLAIGCAEKVSGMRYIPNFFTTTSEPKHSEFVVSIAPQPAGLIPRLGRFLLPPRSKRPFHPYNDPVAAAPATSYGIPSSFAPHPGYEASGPSSREDEIPPVPQPLKPVNA